LKLKSIKNGEWVWPKMHGYKMQCCGCGLTHELDFVAIDEETGEPINGVAIMFRAYRLDKKKKTRGKK